MEPEGSLPHSKEPATCPYPELQDRHIRLYHFGTLKMEATGPSEMSVNFYDTIRLYMPGDRSVQVQNCLKASQHFATAFNPNARTVAACTQAQTGPL
jgi:hypothetical protein